MDIKPYEPCCEGAKRLVEAGLLEVVTLLTFATGERARALVITNGRQGKNRRYWKPIYCCFCGTKLREPITGDDEPEPETQPESVT